MVNRLMVIIHKIFSSSGKKFLPILMVVVVLTHLPYMKLPAVGNHVWRQCNTLAVAKNYADESMALMEPRVDKRFETSGITGPQFPAYEYILACMYRTMGFSEYYHRWLSLIFTLLSVWAIHNVILLYTKNSVHANAGAFFMAFAPEMYFHGINAVPDVMALCCMLWGWYAALGWLKTFSWKPFFLATALLALAGMIKLQFLMAGLPIAVGFFICSNKPVKAWLQAFIMGSIVAGLSIFWYVYAAFLVKTYGLHEFVHAMRHARSWGEALDILAQNLFSDIPETWVGYVFLPFLLVGIYKSKAVWMRFLPVMAYGVGCLLFYFPVQYQFIHHGYYAIVFMPLLAFVVARGAGLIMHSRFAPWVLIVVMAPIWAWVRIAPNNWMHGTYRIPEEFVNPSTAEKLRAGNDTSERWIVGPDKSGCVYFYYTGTKGFPWDTAIETSITLSQYCDRGAVGFVTDQPALLNDSRHRYTPGYKLKLEKKVGNVGWYRIVP
ncbi:MAG: hypothetical protein EBV15_02340 [Bacteroidetes bacterium]|nr:hypothetical protein [Bacteroidota bacterium]